MKRKQYRGVEKRKFIRLEIPLQVTVFIIPEDEVAGGQKSIAVKSKDLSEKGICIETRHIEIDGVHMLSGSPGAQKNRLALEIKLIPDEKPIKAIGEVCWYDLSRETEEFMFQVGVVFISFESNGKEALKSFLKCQNISRGNFLQRFINRFRLV